MGAIIRCGHVHDDQCKLKEAKPNLIAKELVHIERERERERERESERERLVGSSSNCNEDVCMALYMVGMLILQLNTWPFKPLDRFLYVFFSPL